MKKRVLLVAIAGAIVVGCADEMMDTSYEKVVQEVQANGQHPLVFNTYIGNGMANTRATLSNTNTVANNIGDVDGNSGVYDVATRGFGIFAYYTKDKDLDDYGVELASENIFYTGTPSAYTTSDRFYRQYDSSLEPIAELRPDFMYNTRIWSSGNNIGEYDPTTEQYDFVRKMYWPTGDYTNASDHKISFFGYYPHVNINSDDYNSDKNPLHIISKDQSGAPILDYQVATYTDNFESYDLMAAEPVIDHTINDGDVNLQFRHLLSAVSVKLKYTDDDGDNATPLFSFNKASLHGAYNDGTNPTKVTEKSMFRKRGLFNLATGQWYIADYESLDLLGNTYLLNNDDGYGWELQDGSYYTLFNADPDNVYSSSTDWRVTTDEGLKDSNVEDDGYMLIIPNSNQNRLMLDLNYSVNYGSYTENIDVKKDINLQIEPGKIYQIEIAIEKKAMTITCDVSANSWVYSGTTTP